VADAARRWWPLAAAIVLGLIAGLLVSLLQSGTRRAEASVLISSPAGVTAVKPLLPNLRELATSGVVAGNVRSTLRLTESTESLQRRLHATVRPESQVIAISATDNVADHARQVAQEAAVVFAQLVQSRFGTGSPELHAAVLDSAHVLEGPDRHYARNVLFGGLVGLLIGSTAMFLLASRSPRTVVAAADDTELRRREQLLEQRLSSVSARERALAAHAGKLTAREHALEARAAKLDETEWEPAAPVEPPPPPAPEPAPEPRGVSGSEPLTPAPEPIRSGAWNLEDLQRLVDAATDATPEQQEEWRTYLFFLREHASADASLPRSLDSLVNDVFGELLN
jgi:hypothetical protein